MITTRSKKGNRILLSKKAFVFVPKHSIKEHCGCKDTFNHNDKCEHRRYEVGLGHGYKVDRFKSSFCFDPCVQIRLAGLNGGLNFQLFRFKGCRVRINILAGEREKAIRGVICNVGTDFVDLKQLDGTVITIMQERIVDVHWLSGKCGPCNLKPRRRKEVCPPIFKPGRKTNRRRTLVDEEEYEE